MVELHRQGKRMIRTREISGNLTGSHIIAKQEEVAKEIINFASRSISGTLRRDF